MIKKIHCTMCGRELATYDITLTERTTLHKLESLIVCDQPCGFGTSQVLGGDRFNVLRKVDERCKDCGGSLHNGVCAACINMPAKRSIFFPEATEIGV